MYFKNLEVDLNPKGARSENIYIDQADLFQKAKTRKN
jgi:hypothetical protein